MESFCSEVWTTQINAETDLFPHCSLLCRFLSPNWDMIIIYKQYGFQLCVSGMCRQNNVPGVRYGGTEGYLEDQPQGWFITAQKRRNY